MVAATAVLVWSSLALAGGVAPAHASADRAAGAGTAATAVDDGWTTTSPESMGMDSGVLDGARGYAFEADRHTQGVVVVRGGQVVSEWYAPGEGPQSWAASWSMAKSFASTLVGMAIDDGKIPSVDVSMADYFPEWAGTDKAKITLRDVLHMESGLQWNEDYNPTNIDESDIIQLGISADELAYASSRPVAFPPGTRWNYSSGEALLLTKVIEVATGMRADEYARLKLFGPLGIHQVEWWRDGADHTLTYCCLDTTSRDFARYGLLYLRNGSWGGRQVVSQSWVNDSLTPTANSDGVYGYQWWITSTPGVEGPIYMANGHDGQFIYVIPGLDMVVVRNGDYVKSACEPVADPTLFGPYPPSGLAPGRGTTPPGSWSHDDFLAPIVASVTGPIPGGDAGQVPAAEPQPESRNPGGEPMDPCAPPEPPPTTPVPDTSGSGGNPATSVTPSAGATPIAANPSYTG